MDEDQVRRFAVETTAEIEVLRQTVAFMMVRDIMRLPPNERSAYVAAFEADIGEMTPPHYDLEEAAATRFDEDVAAAVPGRADLLLRSLRRLIERNPPG